MPYLNEEDLKSTFYPRAVNMNDGDIKLYLQRANSYAWGYIGGMPPTVDDQIKAAVAAAFEVLSQAETGAVVNSTNGNITEAAPAGFFARSRQNDPMTTVNVMLQPYKDAFEAANTAQSDRGFMFL